MESLGTGDPLDHRRRAVLPAWAEEAEGTARAGRFVKLGLYKRAIDIVKAELYKSGMTPEPLTRRALLERLKLGGPQTAQALAEAVKVTAMAVRQHLYGLQAEGLVTWTTAAAGKGRPSKLWGLTGEASRLFPDAHQELAVGLLSALREALGPESFDKVLAQRGADQTALYAAAMPGEDIGARVQALAEIRNREGYMAEARAEPDGAFLLIENHCPVCAAASACSGICASELMVFRAVLGPGARIERTDHILAGARRCAYRITPGRAPA